MGMHNYIYLMYGIALKFDDINNNILSEIIEQETMPNTFDCIFDHEEKYIYVGKIITDWNIYEPFTGHKYIAINSIDDETLIANIQRELNISLNILFKMKLIMIGMIM